MSNIGQSGIRLDYNGHFVIDESCQINKQNAYLLLAFLQSGSVPELDMHESKHFLPGPFVHSGFRPSRFFPLHFLLLSFFRIRVQD
jgi:hypothetical protein